MKLDMVGIIVEDMNRALSFYQTLGFTVQKPILEQYNELINDGVRISLNTRSMIESVYQKSIRCEGERIELAFKCNHPNDVDTIIEHMRHNGYKIYRDPWDAIWGQRYALLEDTEGNILSIFAESEMI